MKASSKEDLEKGKGIDIGTVFIRCAEKKGDSIVFRSERDAFFEIDYNDFTKKMLTSSQAKYIQKEDKLHIVGDEALNFANIFNEETRRPLNQGIINSAEKEALAMAELLIKSIVGESNHRGEIAYYSLPGPPLDAHFNLVYHEKILQGFLTKLGYTAKSINEGLAVAFSELADNDFTGMGLSFGGGMVNICFSFMSVPIFTFSLTKAGDWIDEQAAMAMGESASRICVIKESSLDLTKQGDLTKAEAALSIYYNHLIEYVIENIKREFTSGRKLPRIDKPIPIVLSGGTAMPKGFAQRFERILSQAKLPFEVGEVRMASQPLTAIAKGALVAAMADEAKK